MSSLLSFLLWAIVTEAMRDTETSSIGVKSGLQRDVLFHANGPNAMQAIFFFSPSTRLSPPSSTSTLASSSMAIATRVEVTLDIRSAGINDSGRRCKSALVFTYLSVIAKWKRGVAMQCASALSFRPDRTPRCVFHGFGAGVIATMLFVFLDLRR
jgi:hypothetical protein